MPSANITPAAKAATPVNGDIMDYIHHPMKPALTIVEHKIRNLEKRKGKLDQYKSEQDSGKELNSDQLAAVAKYGEVIQQLELARDLMKQIGQANDDTRKEIKKHRKAEVAERALQETEKLRTLFLFQMVIKELENADLSESDDNSDLINAVRVIKKHQFVRYSELLNTYDPNIQSTVDMLAANWIQVLDGSKKQIDSQSGSKDRTTFKNIRDNLLAIANSDYFANKCHKEPAAIENEEVVNEDNNVSDSESIPSSATNANVNLMSQDLHRIEPLIISAPIAQPIPTPSVCHVQDSTYQFLQDSQLDLGSPHFDPAVVAVSSSLPNGPICNPHFDHHQVRNAQSAYTITTPASQHQLVVSMSNGMGDRIVADYGQKPIMPLIDDKITEWKASDAHQHQNGNHQDDRNGSDENEGGNQSNRFGSNNRGSRGGTGRGFRRGSSSNGFPHRGNSRGGRPSTGFSGQGNSNNRIGYFRSDQPQQQDHSFDNREFRSSPRSGSLGGSGGGGSSGYSGGGNRNPRESGSGPGPFGNSNSGSRTPREPGQIANLSSGGRGRDPRSETGGYGGGYGPIQRQRVGGSGGLPQGHGQGGPSNYGGGYRGGAGVGARGGNNKPAPRTSESNANGFEAKCY